MNPPADFPFIKDGPTPPIRWDTNRKTPHRVGRLQSQSWGGEIWEHDILLLERDGDTCVLNISGDFVEEADTADFHHLASETGLSTATIFGIPNQPIKDRREDDLIAHTFERWLETKDHEELLLVPMVRSVLAAMDALQRDIGFKKFVLMGASKRGWTAWLAALTGDPRIVGVAPIVFDNLDFQTQMQHQVELWGDFSDKLDDYSSRGLQDLLNHPEGLNLAKTVDPYHHLHRLQAPVFVVNGSNDEFWTIDALSRYWEAIPHPKSALIVPNVGHDLGDRKVAYAALGQFARSRASGLDFPQLVLSREGSRWSVESTHPVSCWTVHTSTSTSLNFSSCEWIAREVESEFPSRAEGELSVESAEGASTATFVMAEFAGDIGPYCLTTPAWIIKP